MPANSQTINTWESATVVGATSKHLNCCDADGACWVVWEGIVIQFQPSLTERQTLWKKQAVRLALYLSLRRFAKETRVFIHGQKERVPVLNEAALFIV